MGKLEDRILDVLAEIIARFIVGFAAVYAIFWILVDIYFDIPTPPSRWVYAAGGIIAGVVNAFVGTRKGPGAI